MSVLGHPANQLIKSTCLNGRNWLPWWNVDYEMANHDPRMMRQELERIREWAIEQLAEGTERPWSWFQYTKLREALESILAGIDVAEPMADSEKASPDRGDSLRQVGAVDLQPY